MSVVVERPIRTRAATPEYEVGYVMTFRRCPACNDKMVCDSELTDPATGDLVKLEMHCPDKECGERVMFDLSDPADDTGQPFVVALPDGFGGHEYCTCLKCFDGGGGI